MSIRKIWIPIVLVVIGALLYVSYQSYIKPTTQDWGGHDTKMKDLDARLRLLAKRVQKFQGEVLCKKADDCRVVGLGGQVCKGYNSFLVYSLLDAREPELLEAVREFNEAAAELNNLSFDVPNCGKDPKPIVCKKNKCVPDL